MRQKFYAILLCLAFAAGCANAGGATADAATQTAADQITQTQAAAQSPDAQSAEAQAPSQTADEPSALPQGGGGPITITDMTGRMVTLPGPATRIVALTAADCENLYAIGAGDTLVGRGEYCDYPPEVLNIPSVQSGAETNLEQIIALKPQVLLMGTMDQTDEQIVSLENAGIKTVVSNAQDIDGVYTAIQMLGNLMGRQGDADEVVSKMKTDFASVSGNAGANKGKTVYFEVSPLQQGLWTAGSGTFMDEIAGMIGLTNCFGDVSGWGQISEEQVIERNPDYIVTITMYNGEGQKPEDEIMSRAGWGNINAVKNKAILNLQNNELSRPSYRLADGAKLLNDFVNGHR